MTRQRQVEGESRKGQALELLEARRDLYILRGRRALLTKMLAGDGTGTADDVRAAVELPADLDPRCLGPVPGRLAYDGVIALDGFVRSERPEGHRRWVQVWRLRDRPAVEQWLRGHPDRDQPADQDGPQRLLLPVTTNATSPSGVAAGLVQQ